MIVWTDVETTDTNERTGHLLEAAIVVTDDDLTEIASTSVLVKPVGIDVKAIPLPDVVREMHTKSGLLDAVARYGLRRCEAEDHLTSFVVRVFQGVPDIVTKGKDGEVKTYSALSRTPLAGSSVHFDSRWLEEHMPRLRRLFWRRLIDVSVFTELTARWMPKVYEERPSGESDHRALPDALHSIRALRYFRDRIGMREVVNGALL